MNARNRLVIPLILLIAILTFVLACQKDVVFFVKNITGKEGKGYSQFNEELLIRNFFNDRRGGIFLDVGSNDYKNINTTFYLEEKLGWRGIAVDALAEFAEGYLQHRPNTKFCNFIVTDHSGTIEPFYRLVNDPGRSSINKEAMLAGAKKHKINKRFETVYVPTITLDELLQNNNISEIDFLSMDIEGGEVLALAGFNIEKFKPKLVCIEKGGSHSKAILDYFVKHNYERIEKYRLYDHLNWYFQPKLVNKNKKTPGNQPKQGQ
jgi:FkbM family methyltransferase